MTVTDPPQHSPLSVSPSLKLPWMQALIHAGARLTQPEEVVSEATAEARNAVHYVLCGTGPGTVEDGTDFLTAVQKARKLVASGARRIVFLTFGNTEDNRLEQSLFSFVRHAGRALTAHPAEFAVVPIHRPLSACILLPEGLSSQTGPRRATHLPKLGEKGLLLPAKRAKPENRTI